MVFAHRDELLDQIATGIGQLDYRTPLSAMVVVFQVPIGNNDYREYEFSFSYAISALASGITWDERGDWSEANRAIVRII